MHLSLSRSFGTLLPLVSSFALIAASCGEHEGRIDAGGAGGASDSGGGSGGVGGAVVQESVAGNLASAGASDSEAGAGGTNGSEGSEGGSAHGGSDPNGGMPAMGMGGMPAMGMGGMPSAPAQSCVYHSEAPETGPLVDQAGGAGGAGPGYTVTVLKNSFVGNYLADSEGRALYVYGADYPGDCTNLPVTNCHDDCLLSWPVFEAGPRVLPDNLDDSLFGAIQRNDGTMQTTYRGWPLYYYKRDVEPNTAFGHGRGIWHLAEIVLPNIVILSVNAKRMLADEFGHTLYAFAEDTLGTESADPQSACTGDCLDRFRPFMVRHFSPVTYLEPSNFSFFVRADGGQQIAYKGAPLYWSNADLRSGEINGAVTPGWGAVAP